jgi:hypothetical protein
VVAWLCRFERNRSGGLDDPAPLDAGRTHHDLPGTTVEYSPNALQVRIETALGHIMGMADVASHHRFFPTYRTGFGHGSLHCGKDWNSLSAAKLIDFK